MNLPRLNHPVSPSRRDFVFGAPVALSATMLIDRAGAQAPQADHSNLIGLTALEALAFLRGGDVTAERYAEALLAQCRRHRDLNAFTWQNEQQILEAARGADKNRTANRARPLHGLPILVKDNIWTAHVPTSGGTAALRDFLPPEDAPVAAKLFSAGALLVGKTNLHELAYGMTSRNAAFGFVHNPYNSNFTPGGSSGGNGAAIAARMCPVGLGTDTGGSIRVPSALCGIVGLRPTIGRYPTKGMVPLFHTMDTPGPMARSVADLALLDSIITGDHTPVAARSLKGLRLGVPREFFFENLDLALAPIVEKALAELRRAGCVLVEANLPDLEKRYAQTRPPIIFYEMGRDLDAYLKESRAKVELREVIARIASPDVKDAYETYAIGPKASTREEYEAALTKYRPDFQTLYRNYFRSHNVAAMVFPTTLLPARAIGDDDQVELNGKRLSSLAAYAHNSRPMTCAGLPGMNVPVGVTADGLPVGLELDAPWGTDRQLLSLGMAAEALFGKIPSPAL